MLPEVRPYRPGQFYLRELPPLRAVLDRVPAMGLLVCGDCDMTSQFHIGVDLMIRGLDAYLDTLPTEATAAG